MQDATRHKLRLTLNKLSGIRGNLVRIEPEWKKWSFTELVAALFAWTERNPIETKPRERQPEFPAKLRDTSSKAFHGQTRQVEHKYRGCVYCEVKNHKSFACDSLKTSKERRTFLTEKKLCYNCTGAKHRASECNSKQTCQNWCHASICDQEKEPEKMLAARHSNDHQVIYPVVVIDVDGVKCRALLDN